MKFETNPDNTTHDPHAGLNVDIYPVGVLDDLLTACRWARAGHPREALAKLRYCTHRLIELARARHWRSLRQSLNGYLAEPTEWPEGLKSCGSGWTKKRALRSLRRRYDHQVGR